MKLLREYIRELLTEAAKGPGDLPEGVVVVIKPGTMTLIYYGQEADPTKMVTVDTNEWMGFVELASNAKAQKGLKSGPCGGALQVTWAETIGGWGPLLYDVAMEYATERGGGIFADRAEVSSEARHVWNYYLQNRGDVKGIQLDDMENTLTPEEADNCDMDVITQPGYGGGRAAPESDWVKSPLSKRYTKPPTMMNKLRMMGRLVEL